MGTVSAPGRSRVCVLCREESPRPECFLAVDGEERPLCRLCWEQALADPRRAARRLRAPFVPSRFRLF